MGADRVVRRWICVTGCGVSRRYSEPDACGSSRRLWFYRKDAARSAARRSSPPSSCSFWSWWSPQKVVAGAKRDSAIGRKLKANKNWFVLQCWSWGALWAHTPDRAASENIRRPCSGGCWRPAATEKRPPLRPTSRRWRRRAPTRLPARRWNGDITGRVRNGSRPCGPASATVLARGSPFSAPPTSSSSTRRIWKTTIGCASSASRAPNAPTAFGVTGHRHFPTAPSYGTRQGRIHTHRDPMRSPTKLD